MEHAALISDLHQLKRLKKYDRVYYGAEFCQNRIPTLQALKRICSAMKHEKPVTFLTPYVTDQGLEKLKPLLEYLSGLDQLTEVVFNDWGVLKWMQERRGNIVPVLGRLLSKQKRDPRIQNVLLNQQKFYASFDGNLKKQVVVLPKKVPPALFEHFKGSVIDVPAFQEFLLRNHIKRVEIDCLAWEMKMSPPEGMGISIYSPYGYVATTRFCGLLNVTSVACGKKCKKYYFSLKGVSSPLPFYIHGNTVFYKTKMPDEISLKKKGVDRIVHNLNAFV